MNSFRFFFVFLLLASNAAHSATVLFFLLGTNAADRHVFEFLAQQVALRHHDTITVKPVLIPEEPRLVKPRLHLVREKMLKNLLPKRLFQPLEEVGGEVPWRKTYELDAYEEPYWRAHNHSCEKMLNSNLMSTLKKDQIEVAVVYGGNPCQLAIVHALGIPFVYFDFEGFTDETVVASGSPWNLEAPSSRTTDSKLATRSPLVAQLLNGLQLVRESFCQLKPSVLSAPFCPRAALLDEPISRMFAEDYEIRKSFKQFPHVNWIKQNAELYFVNTHPLLEAPGRSFPLHVIPVGGSHIDFPRPLFSPWNTSVGPDQSGIILVQMGANVESSSMPPATVRAFVGALSRLKKYRIHWRIGNKLELNGVDLDSLPPHINNLLKMEQKGVGVVLEKGELSETSLLAAIRHVLETPKFERNAQELSKEFNEQPGGAFERVLNGIEHVARHRAAKFLRSAERPKGILLFLRVTNLDFFVVAFGLLVLLLVVSYFLLFAFVRFLIPAARKAPADKPKEAKDAKKHR
ncbi:Glucuronosyltransferase [Aphelenchoides fujianensis]|nr:Glucuronosyltransferase [Aphelenchoides fujianensis]